MCLRRGETYPCLLYNLYELEQMSMHGEMRLPADKGQSNFPMPCEGTAMGSSAQLHCVAFTVAQGEG